MNSLEIKNDELVFDQKQIIPQGNNLWSHIDWEKVITNSIWWYFPKPVNWNKAINEEWEFDIEKFILSRLHTNIERWYYLNKIKENTNYFPHLKKREDTREILYNLKSSTKELITQFEKMYGLEKNWAIYEKSFYLKLKYIYEDISEQLEQENSLPERTKDTSKSIKKIEEVENLVQECLIWENKERNKYLSNIQNIYIEWADKYIKEGMLNVDKILETIDSHRDRNTDTMLIAFYKAKSNKEDLQKLQDWVNKVLENKFKRLDTTKIFTILERVLPYINEDFSLKFNLPELFRPEYLKHITSYDLTLERFADQIKNKWKQLWRSKEIQNKLIEQFKIFGKSEWDKIAFWQWSEQL